MVQKENQNTEVDQQLGLAGFQGSVDVLVKMAESRVGVGSMAR